MAGSAGAVRAMAKRSVPGQKLAYWEISSQPCLNGKRILADTGYDSDKFVCWLEERGGIAVIPSRIIAKHPRKTDWHTYKERHLVENLFLKLKNNRRFATRYEKEARYFRAVVCLACILVWLL